MTLLPLKEFKTIMDVENCPHGSNPFVDLLDLSTDSFGQDDYRREVDRIFRALGEYDIILTDCYAENKKQSKQSGLYKLESKVAFKVSRLLNSFPEHVFIDMNMKVTDTVVFISHKCPAESETPFELFIVIEADKLSQLKLKKSKFLNISIFTNHNSIKGDYAEALSRNLGITNALRTMFGQLLPMRESATSIVAAASTAGKPKGTVQVVGDYFGKTKRPLAGYNKRIWT